MHHEIANNIRNLFQYRSLIKTLAFTDIQVRYKNTVLGFLWSMVEPLAMFVILYFVFTFLRQRTENFELFLFLGIIMWRLFTNGTTLGMTSISNKKNMLNRVALPLEVPVLSSLVIAVVTITFPFAVYFAMLVAFQFVPPITLVFLPLVVLLEAVLVLGISFMLSVLSSLYNDIKQIWPIVINAGFFLTPIWYDLSDFPAGIREWFFVNPMAGIITISRASTLGSPLPVDFPWLYTIGMPFLILVIGYFVFRHYAWRVIEV